MEEQAENLEQIIRKISEASKTEVDSKEKILEKKTKKLTRGKVRLDGDYLPEKTRRQTCFSKRKIGMFNRMKNFENLTGAQGMLILASQTGYIYTYASESLKDFASSTQTRSAIHDSLVEYSKTHKDFNKNCMFCPVNSHTIKVGPKRSENEPAKKKKKKKVEAEEKKLDPQQLFQSIIQRADNILVEPVEKEEKKNEAASSNQLTTSQIQSMLFPSYHFPLTYQVGVTGTWFPPKE